ncbi:uncharacterized protein HKW66_Vig0079550 [Vigna angularis]|uniref:Uncharacterized protein n=1 Tax=Phaseolus angularis TaxID=3914 RepID=A0A8T0K4N0_PHAAN|nr:uncharacterized protein HKW66_Vig0079550 [Vigna angularis]
MPCESWRHCSSRASVITTTVVALSPVAEFSAAESCDLESSMSILDVVWTTYILLRKVEIILSIPFGSETGAHSVGDGASGDDVDMAERKGLESTICLPIDDNDPPLPSRATLNVGGDAFCLCGCAWADGGFVDEGGDGSRCSGDDALMAEARGFGFNWVFWMLAGWCVAITMVDDLKVDGRGHLKDMSEYNEFHVI